MCSFRTTYTILVEFMDAYTDMDTSTCFMSWKLWYYTPAYLLECVQNILHQMWSLEWNRITTFRVEWNYYICVYFQLHNRGLYWGINFSLSRHEHMLSLVKSMIIFICMFVGLFSMYPTLSFGLTINYNQHMFAFTKLQQHKTGIDTK